MRKHTTHFDGCECFQEKLAKAEERATSWAKRVEKAIHERDRSHADAAAMRDALQSFIREFEAETSCQCCVSNKANLPD